MPTKQSIFEANGVRVFVDDKEIVRGVDLSMIPGEVHAVMGPNGSGKSTLVQAMAGHPHYRLEGALTMDGISLNDLEPDARARAGLFLGFQYPVAIPGVTVSHFIRSALEARSEARLTLMELRKALLSALAILEIPEEFASRYINDGFSGGEKKRLEILQLLMLKPKVALLDEIDSGLDIDALKVVATGINHATAKGTAVLLVTHYQRILEHVTPDVVHVFLDGRIVRSGGPEQALELEAKGYEWLSGAPTEATGAFP